MAEAIPIEPQGSPPGFSGGAGDIDLAGEAGGDGIGKRRQAGESPAAPAKAPPAERPAGFDLAAVMARYEGPLLRYAGQVLGELGEEAQDVVQEAFLSLHRQVARHGPASVQNVAAWLWRVTHHAAVDVTRKRQRDRRASQQAAEAAAGATDTEPAKPPGPPGPPGPPAVAEHREACERAMAELGRLPDHQRQVVMLRVVEGMTLTEIAAVTGLSVGNVGYRVSQGLAELARRLKE